MDIQINNRLEAFLYWKVTGIKPEGWDLTPRNKEEEYLAATCNRIDEIAGGGPTPTNPDYVDYINKPIELMPPNEEKDFVDIAIGDTLHFDVTKPVEMELFLKGLTYQATGGPSMTVLFGNIGSGIEHNTLIGFIYPKEMTQTENDAYVLEFIGDAERESGIYIVYSTEAFEIDGDVIPQGFNFNGYAHIPTDGNIEITTLSPMTVQVIPEMYEQDLIKLYGMPALEDGLYYKKTNNLGKTIDGKLYTTLTEEKHVYKHNIKAVYTTLTDRYFYTTIYNNQSTEMSEQDIFDYLMENHYSINDSYLATSFYPATGVGPSLTYNSPVFGIVAINYSSNSIAAIELNTSSRNFSTFAYAGENLTVTDIVQQII